jgi:MFS transporter, SP family, sugar:H+ symporter
MMDDGHHKQANILTTLWKEKRIISISFLIALSQFQYGFDSAAVAGFQSMPGFLTVFGYVDVSINSHKVLLAPLTNNFCLEATNPIGFNISTKAQTLIQSLMQVGGLLASIFIFAFGTSISRRLGLWIASAFVAVSLAIQMGSTHLGALYAGRVLLGMSNGFYLTYSVTYMGEIAPAYIRGPIVGLVVFQTSFGALLGILVDNYTATNVTRASYQIPLGVMYVAPAIISVGIFFLSDTPRYYVSQGREDKAAVSIRRMRGIKDEDRIRSDVAQIKAAWVAEVAQQREVRFMDTFKGTDLRRTMISLGCAVAQTATGIIFLSSFSVYFFVQAQIGSPFIWVMISLAIALTGNMAAFPAARYVDRRILLIVCSVWNMGLMFSMAIVYTVSQVGSPSAGKALVGLSIIYTWVYGVGQGPILWAVQTEVPSQRLRSQTIGLAQGLNFVFAWLCAYCTPYFINPAALNWGPKYCYIWGGSNLLLAIWVFFFVPETRGRSLEQLDELFAKKVPTWKFSKQTTDIQSADAEVRCAADVDKVEHGLEFEHIEASK